jgi:very-short-patch-repair endonuclease
MPPSYLIKNARILRNQMTNAERFLWRKLRQQSLDCTFRRQAPIGPYIVDFVCFERKLVLEIDGGQHMESQGDTIRDRWLEREGFRVLRFWNHEVLKNVDGVLETIATAVRARRGSMPSP